MTALLLLFLSLISAPLRAETPCEPLVTNEIRGNSVIIPADFMKNDRIEIPVFTDVHGNLEGLFRAIGDLQVARKRFFPVIFVTGDLGFFPFPEMMPIEEYRREIKDPASLSVGQFYEGDDLYRRYFLAHQGYRQLVGQIFFLRGNHEDQVLLREIGFQQPREAVADVDRHGVLKFMKDGAVVNFSWPGSKKFSVGVLGGIHPESRPKATARDPFVAFEPKAIDNLLANGQGVDLLLTHQSTGNMIGGHMDVDAMIELLGPSIHLSGHGHHYLVDESEYDGRRTLHIQLKNLGLTARPPLNEGRQVILSLGPDGELELIQENY